ncbi:vacuolating cytotoxin domain-containing protein [Helicobacter mehlei]|nr:vacuolating cytotoxin domain-containing protein [Helicobacter mehlei]
MKRQGGLILRCRRVLARRAGFKARALRCKLSPPTPSPTLRRRVFGGALILGMLLVGEVGATSWRSGNQTLNMQNIGQYIYDNSTNNTWWGGSNKFYRSYSNGGYYCANFNCNNPITLNGNGGGTYTFNGYTYSGPLNINTPNANLQLGNVHFNNNWAGRQTDQFNAQNIIINNAFSSGQNTNLQLKASSITTSNAQISANNGQGISFDTSKMDISSTTFSGNSTLNFGSVKDISFDNTNFQTGNVQFGTLNNATFKGTFNYTGNQQLTINAQDINAQGATISASNGGLKLQSNQSANFNGTTFGGNSAITLGIKGQATFNGATFNNDKVQIQGANSLDFQGTTTLDQASPFTNVSVPITLSPGAVFDINTNLTKGQTFNILGTTGNSTIDYKNYANNLWQLIHYQGATGSLYTGNGVNNPSSGVGTYQVVFNQNGAQYVVQEIFGSNSISLKMLSYVPPPQNVWSTVSGLTTGTYNVGDGGIAYINPNGNTLSASVPWYNFANGSFNVQIKGNGTLILGNDKKAVASGGTIWLGQSQAVIYAINGKFASYNIYMTNNFKTGNDFSGGTGYLGFAADNDFTMKGLNFTNVYAGTAYSAQDWFTANKTMEISQSSFVDNTGGAWYFNAPEMTITNSIFSGDGTTMDFNVFNNNNTAKGWTPKSIQVINSTFTEKKRGSINLQSGNITIGGSNFVSGNATNISLSASQALSVSDTIFNDPWDTSGSGATIALGGSSVSLNNDTFKGTNNAVKIVGAGGNGSAQNLTISNTQFESSKQINIDANQATFTNTTFDTTGYGNPTNNFNIQKATFDNTTFEGYSQYSFSPNGTATFQGTTTIGTTNNGVPASPFATLGGNITLSQNALFNIKNALQAGASYTLLKGKINYNDSQYAKSLWQLVNYQGMQGQLLSQNGDVYTVGFDVGGLTLKMQETLNNDSFTLQLLTAVKDVWQYVQPLDGAHSVSIGDGIAYIDPNQKNAASPYFNPNGNLLQTWGTSILGIPYHTSFTINVDGTGTLVIGNNRQQVANGGTISLGTGSGQGSAAWLCPTCYVTGTFNAPNIYLTNTFKTGNFAYGQGAGVTFNATNDLTADGLTYSNVATAFPGIQTGISQHSRASFSAQTMEITNSHFFDATWGSFSFTGSKQITFNQSAVQGSNTQVTLNSPSISLNGGGFFLGLGSTLSIGNNGGGASLEGTDATFNLNQQSHATFNTAVNLEGDSALFLNNSSTATFNQQADFAGDSALNLDNASSITFNGNTTLSGNALLSLMNTGGQKTNQSKVAFNGTTTLSGNANISLSQGSVATFKGLATFGGQSSLNMVGTGQNTQNGQPQTTATFQGGVTFGAQSSLNLSDGASASIQGQSNFEGNTTNLSNSSLSLQDVTFNAGNLVVENSTFNASGAVSSDGTTNMNLYGNNSLSMGSFTLNGFLNLNGAMSPDTAPLIKVTNNFTLAQKGKLNLSNIDIFTNLGNKKSKTFDILKAGSIVGLSGADGYQNIGLYGLPIQDALYNQANDSWSFVNPLNGNQIITESVQNNNLTITISANPNPSPTLANLYNIAPELFYYKQSKQNTTGTSYDYSDDRVGTFFLDSNIKGTFTAPITAQNPNPTPQVPTTYNTSGHPLDPLYIYNSPINKQVLANLFDIASSLFPALEQLLKSFNINDLSDPNKLLQALSNSNISLTDQQKQQLLDFIGSLSSNINQTFKNGTLVVGAPQVGQVNNTSQVWFGGNGYAGICAQNSICKTFGNTYLGQLLTSTAGALGYIDANFNAKDIYITGTLGSGNATQTGGSASVSFNSATNLVLNQANVTAEQTDQVFNLLGTGGIDKILGQPGLGQALGNIIYQTASNNGLIPQGLQDLLPKSLSSKTLGSIFNASDLGPILQLPGFATAIKDIMTSKTVGSLLGSNGLISHLDSAQQAKIYTMLNDEIQKGLNSLPTAAKIAAQVGLGIVGGTKGAQSLIDKFYAKDTLWTLMEQLSPATGMTLNQALAMGDTPQGVASLQKFLDTTTFGQIFKIVFENTNLVNQGVAWLGPQLLGTILNMAIQDAINPPKALTNMAQNVGMKILSDILGPDTIKALQDNTMVSNVINGIIKDGGLGGVWQKGLGSILPPNLQEALKKAGVGSLLAPKGLSTLWEKGYFSFLANDNVFVNNSTFSNATGGDLSFVAGKSLYFVGNNSIDFTNYQGTLNLFSNDVSNINLTTLNATNGLTINAQFNNLAVQKGTIALNQYESLSVSANNFGYLGTINADGAVNLSSVTNQTELATLNLTQNSTLQANNLTITKALTSTSNSVLNVAQNLNLQSGATLDLNITKLPAPNTQATQTPTADGLQIGGGFNSAGTVSLSVDSSLAPSQPLIQANGLINFSLNTQTPLSFSVQAPQGATAPISGAYTLMQSNSWIHYNPTTFNPNNWQDYLNLYTSLKINGTNFQLNAQGTGLTYNGQAVNISDRGLLVTYQNGNNQSVSASIAYNKIQVGVNQPLNIEVPTIKQYISQIQGEASVRAIEQAGGPDVMGWFNKLLIQTKNTPLFAPYYLEQHSLQDMVKMAKDIANSIDLIASPTLKANASDLLQISSHTKQMSRLAKLSSFSAEPAVSFHDFLQSLKGKKFASAVPNAMDIITAYSQRDRLKNNFWVTGVGGASFVAGGTGTLYGINIGYDRFIKGVIVGGYAAYGYSGFYGNISNASSNNVNLGFYSRAFLKGRHELTGSINETWGYNKATINAINPILSVVNQKYDYNTWTTNIGANYGYDFFFKEKRVILKPQIGLTYYYIGLSRLQGSMNNPLYNQFKANADPANKSVLTLNLALESRHYFKKNSYYYVIAGIGRDLFVNSMGDKQVRFIGNDTLSYRNGGLYNTFMSLTTGGEVRLWRSFYINAGIGARFGLDYKDINITGNVGMRYAF